jgi:hypothetical protein
MKTKRRIFRAVLLLLSTTLSVREALAIRAVDPLFVENDCQPEIGVHPSALSIENEKVFFNSTVSPGEVPVVCPQGFKAGEQKYTSTGGTCSFRPTPAHLVFSCLKNFGSECDGGACEGNATVQCVPLPTEPSSRVSTEACRTPGLYGQISALSAAMMASSVLNSTTETLADLQNGKALPPPAPESTPNAAPSEQQQEEPHPQPQSISFPGPSARPRRVAPP